MKCIRITKIYSDILSILNLVIRKYLLLALLVLFYIVSGIWIIYPYEVQYNDFGLEDFRRRGYNETLDWAFSREQSILFN